DSLHASPVLRLQSFVPGLATVLNGHHLAELGYRAGIRAAYGSRTWQVEIVGGEFIPGTIVDKIGGHRRVASNLPAHATAEVERIGQPIIVGHNGGKARSPGRYIIGKTLATQDCVDVGEKLERVRVRDVGARSRGLLLSLFLEPGTVPGYVFARASMQYDVAVAFQVPRHSKPWLEVRPLVPAITAYKVLQSRELGVLQQPVVEGVIAQICVHIPAQSQVEANATQNPPIILNERSDLVGCVFEIAWSLLDKCIGVGGWVVDVERSVSGKIEFPVLEVVRLVVAHRVRE